MDIFKDRPFGQRFDSLPTLDSNEKLHIGLEVIKRVLTDNINKVIRGSGLI